MDKITRSLDDIIKENHAGSGFRGRGGNRRQGGRGGRGNFRQRRNFESNDQNMGNNNRNFNDRRQNRPRFNRKMDLDSELQAPRRFNNNNNDRFNNNNNRFNNNNGNRRFLNRNRNTYDFSGNGNNMKVCNFKFMLSFSLLFWGIIQFLIFFREEIEELIDGNQG